MRPFNNISLYRQRLSLSQAELANLVCVSRSAISSFERGESYPSAYTAYLLCKIFRCTFEELFHF